MGRGKEKEGEGGVKRGEERASKYIIINIFISMKRPSTYKCTNALYLSKIPSLTFPEER